MIQHHKTTLPNGLTILTIPMPQVDSVTVMVMLAAGSRYETKSTNGIAHFMEHMAFKGSVKRPSALAISSEIDGIGGEFNAFTGKDHTGFYIKARAEHTPLLIDVLSDMILHPLLKNEEIEREKGVICEEINMYEDTPMRHIGDVFENLLYGDTPLGWDTAGKTEIIKKITRKNFTDYIQQLYKPNNALIVVAGKVEPSLVVGHLSLDLISLIEKSLSDWKKEQVQQYPQQSDKQTQPALKVVYKKTEQAHLSLGVRAYSLNSPKKYALTLLGTILGGGMSSRLFIEIRERRGLAYYVHADASQYQDVGYFAIQAGVDVNRIDQAITVIIEQLQGIVNGKLPLTEKELAKAKAYLKGRTTLEMEDSRAQAGFYGTQEILKREIITPQDYFAKLDKITLKDIYAVAKEIFVSKHINLAIIGPYKDETRFKKLL
jgi:predicted Zn-dependent peptidase